MIDKIRHFILFIWDWIWALSTLWINYLCIKIHFTYCLLAYCASDSFSIINIQIYPPVTVSNNTHSQLSLFPQKGHMQWQCGNGQWHWLQSVYRSTFSIPSFNDVISLLSSLHTKDRSAFLHHFHNFPSPHIHILGLHPWLLYKIMIL